MYRRSARLGAIVLLLGGVAVTISGDLQSRVMTQVQPMKMAAAEALYDTSPEGTGASFSIISKAISHLR